MRKYSRGQPKEYVHGTGRGFYWLEGVICHPRDPHTGWGMDHACPGHHLSTRDHRGEGLFEVGTRVERVQGNDLTSVSSPTVVQVLLSVAHGGGGRYPKEEEPAD